MGNMLLTTIKIRGTRPMLWHAFGPDAIPLEKRERTGVAGNDPIEWTRTVLMTSSRQLYVPPTYLFSCLRDGAKYTRKGKGSIQATVAATLQITDDRILVDRFVPEEPQTDPEQPVYIHISSVRNPATKARNVRYRIAAATGWELTFSALWDRTIVSRSEIEAVAHDAGMLSGLGDGRTIGFGRFVVVSFAAQDA
jgi:hypothetical protein